VPFDGVIGESMASAATPRRTEPPGPARELLVRRLGRRAYRPTWEAMRAFSEARNEVTPDEIWILEHPPIFTLGQAGRREHLLAPGDIPVLQVDRGGQVTYHGPGQLVVYVLYDLRRAGFGVRHFVHALEQAVIDLAATQGIVAARRARAPGVYVAGAKLASVGLRVRNGRAFHGIALNVNVDLTPFSRIDPCGYPGLQMTRLADLGLAWDPDRTASALLPHLAKALHARLVSVAPDRAPDRAADRVPSGCSAI